MVRLAFIPFHGESERGFQQCERFLYLLPRWPLLRWRSLPEMAMLHRHRLRDHQAG